MTAVKVTVTGRCEIHTFPRHVTICTTRDGRHFLCTHLILLPCSPYYRQNARPLSLKNVFCPSWKESCRDARRKLERSIFPNLECQHIPKVPCRVLWVVAFSPVDAGTACLTGRATCLHTWQPKSRSRFRRGLQRSSCSCPDQGNSVFRTSRMSLPPCQSTCNEEHSGFCPCCHGSLISCCSTIKLVRRNSWVGLAGTRYSNSAESQTLDGPHTAACSSVGHFECAPSTSVFIIPTSSGPRNMFFCARGCRMSINMTQGGQQHHSVLPQE